MRAFHAIGVGDLFYGRAAVLMPIAMMFGIGGYFWLPAEPPLWAAGLGLAAVAGLAAVGIRRAGWPSLVLILVAMGILGASAAVLRTQWVAAPVVAEQLEPRVIYGRLLAVDRGASRPRILLDRLWVAGLTPEETPKRIRLTTSGEIPAVGTRLRVYAVLRPPGPPVAPGAFDFRRYSYFRQIGAVGWTLGAPRLDAAAPETAAESMQSAIGRLRDGLSQRIQERIGGAGGAVAAALLVGDRAGIPRADLEVIRASGLAHLLAISGLHMALVITAIMFVFRAGLPWLPTLGERFPTKKVSAAIAFVAGAGYLVLTGAPVSAQRAFIMAGLVLVAILLDRKAISLRLVALAAVIVLLLAPESLVEPSFQMSFAATAALVAAYERYGQRVRLTVGRDPSGGVGAVPRAVAAYAVGLAFSSFVAIVSTAPIAAWHFHHFPLFGLPANMLAVPIVGLWVMPLGLMALALTPLGWEGPFLHLMGFGIGLVLDIAWWIGGRPDAVLKIPAAPPLSLVLWCVGGGLFLLAGLWGRRLSILPAAAAMALAFLPSPPDALVDGSGRLAGLRLPDGYHLTSTRSGRFAARQWSERAAVEGGGGLPPGTGTVHGTHGMISCQPSRCRLEKDGWRIDLVRHAAGLRRACAEADAVIALMTVRMACQRPLVIDRPILDSEGAVGLWIDPDKGIVVRSVHRTVGDRPWTY
ncbi:MAG: ComEC family competence protein [Alphaproteobacteria bacterium]|nr:ComEC family competence protein [Alphaproteobacteria bacterium]